ncbi:MAG: hypothetical protein HOE53_00790 [Candidatus Magasanikbacteria bacterium]|jgi:hypothetical protein|nr:hypothetical protein [Candidatus Magasanikbacteria bacterium]
MKHTAEVLKKTFSVEADEASKRIALRFISADVGKENIDLQSDLVAKEIMAVHKTYPDLIWRVSVDTATTKVYSMSKHSTKQYEKLINHPAFEKIAILVDDTDTQHKIASFVLSLFAKKNKKINIFTSEEEANMWLCR